MKAEAGRTRNIPTRVLPGMAVQLEAAGSRKRKKNPLPEWEFQRSLAVFSREGDVDGALALYRTSNLRLNAQHFNTLLHTCATALSFPKRSPDSIDAIVEEAFRIFDRMVSSGISPSESTITSMARIAAADEDKGGMRSFELVKSMEGSMGISMRLRTYDPALFAFCRTKEHAEKAYSVEDHMVARGLSLEEAELAALFRVSSESCREDKVYEYLHKLRRVCRSVSKSTGEILKQWFQSDCAASVGQKSWDGELIRDAFFVNGGGWHGKGWLGNGEWRVQNSEIDFRGFCSSCEQRLVSVDLSLEETEKFAESVALLALARESESNFSGFQEWLSIHQDYDLVVDGANVGYYHQNFADGGFSFPQIQSVIKEILDNSHAKKPLIILHNKRVLSLLENRSYRELLDDWISQEALYVTPNGSNDDWYWIYASVRLKCLLLTNDEMRDHIFELLGESFFARWKERHQVRYTFLKGDPKLEMPPSYSPVIQESENGSWHIPIHAADNQCNKDPKPEAWICITRHVADHHVRSAPDDGPPAELCCLQQTD